MGHRQTMQTQVISRKMRRLIRVSTICLQNNLVKKMKKKITTHHPLKRKWAGPIKKMGNSVRHEWINNP